MKHMVPPAFSEDMRRAERLAWWTLGVMASVVAVMWFAAGSSQAMQTAFVEDLLGLVPAAVFLIATKFERRAPTARFPFGFHRVHSLSALIAAVALASVGALLLFDALKTLALGERATIPPVTIFGREIWMVCALIYSAIPRVVLGKLKQPIAKRLQDEVLDTDAMMQRADWMTGLAGIGGIIGLGLGYWWADALAAAIISFSIIKDGVTSLRVATAELVDGTPRAFGKPKIAKDAAALQKALEHKFPEAEVRMRETGRYIRAEVIGADGVPALDLEGVWPSGQKRPWRLAQVSFVAADAFSHRSRR